MPDLEGSNNTLSSVQTVSSALPSSISSPEHTRWRAAAARAERARKLSEAARAAAVEADDALDQFPEDIRTAEKAESFLAACTRQKAAYDAKSKADEVFIEAANAVHAATTLVTTRGHLCI